MQTKFSTSFHKKSATSPSPAPAWLSLRKFHFPLQAKLSIAHRVTGIITILFLLVGLGILNLWILQPTYFKFIIAFWHSLAGKLLLWLGLSALLFHWLAGIRHLLMEHNIWQMQTQNSPASAKGLLWLYLFLWGLLSWAVWR